MKMFEKKLDRILYLNQVLIKLDLQEISYDNLVKYIDMWGL